MTNKEILAELKQSYEYMNDIFENEYEQLTKEEKAKLNVIANEIYDIYSSFWNRIWNKEELTIKNEYQDDEKETLLIGNNPCADYTTQNKETGELDSIGIITCADLGYYWYKDKEFLNN